MVVVGLLAVLATTTEVDLCRRRNEMSMHTCKHAVSYCSGSRATRTVASIQLTSGLGSAPPLRFAISCPQLALHLLPVEQSNCRNG